jgi:hypothetical protein
MCREGASGAEADAPAAVQVLQWWHDRPLYLESGIVQHNRDVRFVPEAAIGPLIESPRRGSGLLANAAKKPRQV